jgi:hypothetical protein
MVGFIAAQALTAIQTRKVPTTGVDAHEEVALKLIRVEPTGPPPRGRARFESKVG